MSETKKYTVHEVAMMFGVMIRQVKLAISCGKLPMLEPQASRQFASASFSQAWLVDAKARVDADPGLFRGLHYINRVVPRGTSVALL